MRKSSLLLIAILGLVGCSSGTKLVDIPPQANVEWPWKATEAELQTGVKSWTNTENPDGTIAELFAFDFQKNPNLKFILYDQDEDDVTPWDNVVDYYPRGVGEIARNLGTRGDRVIAAWNGLFFGYDRSKNPPHGNAFHIGNVVVEGKRHHNVGFHRWTFGIDHEGRFKMLFMPKADVLEKEFFYASDGAQCLIRDGKPLRIDDVPTRDQVGFGVKPPASKDTEETAGSYPFVDQLRCSRVSMGWSKDSKTLYLLFVRSADTENEGAKQLREGVVRNSGWNLADLQRFWISLGVWGAVNTDGGVVAQRAVRTVEGKLEVIPAQITGAAKPYLFDESQPDKKGGGTLMTFAIVERPTDKH